MPKLHYLFRHTDRQNPPKATLIVLHGFGANEFDLLGIADYFKESLSVISFRAPITLDWGGYAWYHLSQSPRGELIADDESRKASEEQMLAELPGILEETEAEPNNIYLMGFSQGAAMCYSLMGRHDLKAKGLNVKGMICLSGYIPMDVMDELDQMDAASKERFRGLPVFMSHGEQDQVIPAKALTIAQAELTKLGANVEAKIHPMLAHGISEEVLADLTKWLSARLAEGSSA